MAADFIEHQWRSKGTGNSKASPFSKRAARAGALRNPALGQQAQAAWAHQQPQCGAEQVAVHRAFSCKLLVWAASARGKSGTAASCSRKAGTNFFGVSGDGPAGAAALQMGNRLMNQSVQGTSSTSSNARRVPVHPHAHGSMSQASADHEVPHGRGRHEARSAVPHAARAKR